MLRIFRHYLSSSALSLFVFEGCVVLTILYAAVSQYGSVNLEACRAFDCRATPVFVSASFISLVMYATGLYDRELLWNLRQTVKRMTVSYVICAPILIVFFEYTQSVPPNSLGVRVAFYALLTAALFASVISARITYNTVAKAALAPHRILVVGVGRLAAEIERLMAQNPATADSVLGYLSITDEEPEVSRGKILRNIGSLPAFARNEGVREIIIALDERRGVPVRPFLEVRMTGVTVTSYLSFWERETRRLNLGALEPSWLIYSDGFRLSTVTNQILKRMLDFVASLTLLTFTLPVLAVTALALLIEGAGPVIYRQERVGLNGKRFKICKFRTMRQDAESDGVPQWAALRDPRITRVGAVLRLLRIDELPQIFNVLKGDMSFVGPRPERPFFVDSLTRDIPYYSERHRVRPGITGWAQINYRYGASIEDAKAKLSYDLYYIKNFSLMFDLLIILATVQAVLWQKGAR